MSDADLSRACGAIDIVGARPVPLSSLTSHSVRLYTQLLVQLYKSVKVTNEAVSRVARELFEFEGDFLDVPTADLEKLGPTPLAESMDTSEGSCLFHRVDQLHATAVLLLAQVLRTQRISGSATTPRAATGTR